MLLERRMHKVVVLLALSGAIAALPANNAHAQNPPLSALSPYGRLSTWCGRNPIPREVVTLPSIGCFVLSPAHSASGEIAGHRVEVGVDENGQDVFTADGTVVTAIYDPQQHPPRFSNLPYAHTMGGDGFAFCLGSTNLSCPSTIEVFSRNPDKTVLFIVSNCLPPDYRVCVNTQESWNYETSKRK